VACGDAVRASDWKGEAVVEADDGEPGSRRRSGDQWWPEHGELRGKAMCKSQGVY
jgi:hypothetical protein